MKTWYNDATTELQTLGDGRFSAKREDFDDDGNHAGDGEGWTHEEMEVETIADAQNWVEETIRVDRENTAEGDGASGSYSVYYLYYRGREIYVRTVAW